MRRITTHTPVLNALHCFPTISILLLAVINHIIGDLNVLLLLAVCVHSGEGDAFFLRTPHQTSHYIYVHIYSGVCQRKRSLFALRGHQGCGVSGDFLFNERLRLLLRSFRR